MGNKVLGDRIRERLRLIDATQEALATAVGMKQQSIAMIIAGKVKRPGKLLEIARFLRTTQEYLLGDTNDPNPLPARVSQPSTGILIPILTMVSAGRLADANVPTPDDDAPTILVDDLGRGDFFALEVEGDSMDRLSPPKSRIIVNRRERTPQKGKPYVFAVRGQVTYKLWHPKPLYLAPFSTNPMNEPIFVDKKRDLEIIGRVRRTILDL